MIGAEAISAPLFIIGIIFWIATVLIYVPAVYDEEWAIDFLKKTKSIRILLTIGLVVAMLLPSKEASYKMLVASMVTPNNIATIGETTEDIIDYIVESVDTLLEKEDE